MEPEQQKPKKVFFKRFWWVFIILSIILVSVVFVGANYIGGNSYRIVKTFKPNTGAGFYSNPPTIVAGYIYIGNSINSSITPFKDNYFYKFDLDLKKIWEYKLPESEEVEGGAALDSKGNVYFIVSKRTNDKQSIQENNLYSLTNDGKFRWQKIVSYEGEKFQSGNYTPAVGLDDTIYFGDSKLFAFRPDGSQKWKYPENTDVFVNLRSSPIIDNSGNIYLVAPEPTNGEETENMKVYKFTSNGKLDWSTPLDNNIIEIENGGGYKARISTSTPALSKDQNTIYAPIGNTLNAADTETGNLRWSYKPDGIQGDFEASPSVDNEENVYIGSKANEENVLYAFRADGKGLLWQNKIGSDLYCSPTLGDNGLIYIGSEYTPNDGQFHVIDIKTGKYKWNIGTFGLISDFQKTSPAILNGYAYVGTMNNKKFYGPLMKIKIESQNYLPDAAWPRFHGGNANNGRRE